MYHHRFAERYPLGTTPPKAALGPSLEQEAEYRRRREIAEQWKDDTVQRTTSKVDPELIRQAEEILNKQTTTLEDWLALDENSPAARDKEDKS